MRRATGRWLRGATLIGAALLSVAASPPPSDPWIDRARQAIDLLQRDWGAPADWTGINAWQRFVIVDALIDYTTRSGDRSLVPAIEAAVRNRAGLDGNDDDLWALIADIHAWQLDGDPSLLAMARSEHERIVSGYWDDHCGGGLWWDHARSYKNAITNELLIYASTQLFRATGETEYRDWAMRGWRWFDASGMIGPNGLVNDGLDGACRNNHQSTYTYNQGVLIGGLDDLSAITGDPFYRDRAVGIALAVRRHLHDAHGILREPVDMLGKDGPMFKGILVYHMGHLVRSLPDGASRRTLDHYLRYNAERVWARSDEGKQPIGGIWESGRAGVGGAAAQGSGIDLLVAASAMSGGDGGNGSF